MPTFTNKLLMVSIFVCALSLSQPVLARAQTGAPGTGKTLGAAWLANQSAAQPESAPAGLDDVADPADPASAAKIPGPHKVPDVTLKRG